MMQRELGLTCRSWVIWYYTFGVNCKHKFSRSHAHLFHFVRDAKNFTFNADQIRVSRDLVTLKRDAHLIVAAAGEGQKLGIVMGPRFGQQMPIAVSNPVRYSTRIVAVPLALWINLIAPIRWAVRGVADWVTTRLVGDTKTADNILQVDDSICSSPRLVDSESPYVMISMTEDDS